MFKYDSEFPSYRTVVITLALMFGAMIGSAFFVFTGHTAFSIIAALFTSFFALIILSMSWPIYDFDEDSDDV